MKTLMIILSVLAVTMVAYGFDEVRLRKFNGDFVKCSEEMGISPADPNIEALMCATIRDGEVLNENREYIKAKTLQRLGDLISDAGRLQKARGIYSKCYDDVAQTSITGEEQTKRVITCLLPDIIPLIDQPK